jgi:4-alpha-glucanotransferase
LKEGLLYPDDLSDQPHFPKDHVDYGAVISWKQALLNLSYDRFLNHASQDQKNRFEQFKIDQAVWLDDFALFMAMKDTHGGRLGYLGA